jgi:hypothetical protein
MGWIINEEDYTRGIRVRTITFESNYVCFQRLICRQGVVSALPLSWNLFANKIDHSSLFLTYHFGRCRTISESIVVA